MSEVPRCRDRQETAPARPKWGEGASWCPSCGLPPARRGCVGQGEQEGAAPGVLGIGLASGAALGAEPLPRRGRQEQRVLPRRRSAAPATSS